MKHIIIISFEYPPVLVGGIGKVAFDKVQEFSKRGYTVHLIAPLDGQTSSRDNVLYYSIPKRNNVKKTLRALKHAKMIAAENTIALTYCLTATYAGYVGLKLKKKYNIPYVCLAHGNEFIRFKSNMPVRFLLNKVMARAEFVFSVSEFTKNQLESMYKGSNIEVVYNGIDISNVPQMPTDITALRAARNIKDDEFVFLSISRLDPRKGHVAVINAIALLMEKRPDLKGKIHYLIGGKGAAQDAIENAINTHALHENVKLLGFIDDEDMAGLYAISDMFIMPSVYLKGSFEGFGIVYLEAALHKLPSIGGLVGGSAEAIQDKETGFVVDGDKLDDLAALLEDCIDRRAELPDLGQKAFKRACDNFSLVKIVDHEVSLLKDIL